MMSIFSDVVIYDILLGHLVLTSPTPRNVPRELNLCVILTRSSSLHLADDIVSVNVCVLWINSDAKR